MTIVTVLTLFSVKRNRFSLH